uniref:Uncharacterized protein n=1 Tax=Pristionchus pacificus TaxID=54126 RepID=A0A8R1UES0_PRIPA
MSGSHQSSACAWSDHSVSPSSSITKRSPSTPSTPRRPPLRRRRHQKAFEEHLRGNFTSFFWDAQIASMMSDDHSFSSNGSFYSDSDAEGEDRYCNVKDSLGTAGDSGVASTCSSASDRSSPLYTQILSTTRVPPLRRARSSSMLSSTITTKAGERQSQRRYLTKERRRGGTERRESPGPRKTPQRGTYQSASFHTSRASAKSVASTEGRYNVKKRKIYEDCNVSTAQSVASKRPCCWECFEATVEKERVNAGFPARTAYLPEPMAENHYENISFDASASDADASSAWVRGNRSRASRMSAGPAVPPRRKTREQDEEEEEALKSESDTYARLCSIEFSKLHAAESLFSQERLASLQKKIERLLLIKITAELIALLASAEKKQKSKMDSFKRGIARAVKVIF